MPAYPGDPLPKPQNLAFPASAPNRSFAGQGAGPRPGRRAGDPRGGRCPGRRPPRWPPEPSLCVVSGLRSDSHSSPNCMGGACGGGARRCSSTAVRGYPVLLEEGVLFPWEVPFRAGRVYIPPLLSAARHNYLIAMSAHPVTATWSATLRPAPGPRRWMPGPREWMPGENSHGGNALGKFLSGLPGADDRSGHKGAPTPSNPSSFRFTAGGREKVHQR